MNLNQMCPLKTTRLICVILHLFLVKSSSMILSQICPLNTMILNQITWNVQKLSLKEWNKHGKDLNTCLSACLTLMVKQHSLYLIYAPLSFWCQHCCHSCAFGVIPFCNCTFANAKSCRVTSKEAAASKWRPFWGVQLNVYASASCVSKRENCQNTYL